MIKFVQFLAFLLPSIAIADTPPLRGVNSATFDGSNNAITSTVVGGKRGLDANIVNSSLAISAASLPLPSGAATESSLLGVRTDISGLQSTASAILAALPASLGQKTMAASLPVVIASNQAAIPVSVEGTFEVSVGLTDEELRASAVPVSAASLPLPSGAATESTLSSVNSKLPSGLTVTSNRLQVELPSGGGGLTDTELRASAVPVSGTVTANAGTGTMAVSAASLPLPAGAATESTLSSLNAKVTAVDTGAVVVSSSALPSGAATSAAQSTAQTSLTSIDGKLPSLGQALGSASVPVVLPAAQISTLTPLSTVAVTQATGSNLHVQVDSAPTTAVTGTFWQATQPISASSLPLPSGASTEATLSAMNTKLPSGLTVTSNRLQVELPSGGGGLTDSELRASAVPVSAASLPLPSGASTAAKQPALGTAGTASSDVITVQGIASMTALKVDGSATTQPVSIATAPVLVAGSALIGKVGVDQTTPGTTNAVSLAQIGSTTTATGNGVVGAGVQRVAIASDNTAFSVYATPVGGATPSQTTGTVSTVITLTAPSNAQGFILQNLGTSTTNVRFAMGATATASVGMQLAPGQDSGFIPNSANVSIVAESGTCGYNIQWVAR